jgi:hypothetical protein
MVVLYPVAAVLFALALVMLAFRGIARDRLDHKLLERHDTEGQNPRVLRALVKLRSADKPTVTIRGGLLPGRRQPPDDT